MKRFVRPLVCLHHSGRRTTSVKNNDQTPGVTNNNDVRPSVWRPLPPQKKALLTALGRTEQYLSSALKNGRFSWIEAPRGKEVYVLNFPHEAIPLKILYFMKTYIHLWSHRPGAWQWKGACAGRCTPGERLKKQILIFADICQENFLIVVRTALLYSFLSLFKGKSFPTSVITTPCLIRKNAWSIFRSFFTFWAGGLTLCRVGANEQSGDWHLQSGHRPSKSPGYMQSGHRPSKSRNERTAKSNFLEKAAEAGPPRRNQKKHNRKFPQEGRQGHLKNICKTFAKRLFFHDPSYRLKRWTKGENDGEIY